MMTLLSALTVAALVAFAANSLLCRAALADELIDPTSFTTIRLLSGAVMLAVLTWRSQVASEAKPETNASRSVIGAASLFAYAIAFSLAYISLSAGTGALILFGAVQLTMLSAALFAGERLRFVQSVGFATAIGGLVYLMLPGVTAPDLLGACQMAVAGIAWGVYSIVGRGAVSPLATTARNFAGSIPLAVVASLLLWKDTQVQLLGALFAMLSGAITSGLGYAAWYRVLPKLTTSQAGVLQLTVPIIASIAGILLLGEELTWRLVIATALVLGGVRLAIRSQS